MTSRGAYGLRIEGPVDPAVLRPVADDAPLLTLSQRRRTPDEEPPEGTDTRRVEQLEEGGWVVTDVREGTAELVLAQRALTEDEIVHPFGASAALAMSLSLGRLVLHGSAIAWGDRVTVLVGDREAGKSTFAAWASLHDPDARVLSDDLCVLDRGLLHAGPASVDLRPGGEHRLDLPEGTQLAREGTRRRLIVRGGPAVATVARIVVLAWGDAVRMTRLPVTQRLPALARHTEVPSDAGGRAQLLSLCHYDVWTFARPRNLALMDACLAEVRAATL